MREKKPFYSINLKHIPYPQRDIPSLPRAIDFREYFLKLELTSSVSTIDLQLVANTHTRLALFLLFEQVNISTAATDLILVPWHDAECSDA